MPRKLVRKERGIFEKKPGSDIWWIRYSIDGRERREKVGRRGDAVKLYQVRKADALRGVKLPTNMKNKGLKFEVIGKQAIPGGLDVETGLFGGGFTFLAADRISPQIYYGVSDAESIGGRSLGIHGEWTPNFLAINGSQEIGIAACGHPNARSLQVAHQVEAWMGEVSPGVQILLDTQGKLDLVGMTYSFVARRDVSRRFRPTNVGFGLTYALPVVTAVLASQPGDFLILDSPEAHLHPRGQTKLAELLAKAAQSGVQVIVESHSDHVLNGLRVAIYESVIEAKDVGVLYFRWDRKSDQVAPTVQVIQIDSDGRIAEWPDGFFDEFDKSLSALLRPRK